MFGDGRVNDSPALVGEDDRNVEQPKRCGRHDEHVDGRDAFGVIPQEGAPGRGRSTSSSHHVPGDRRLADLDTELEKFAVGPGRAPERVCYAHLPNQFTNFSMYLGAGPRQKSPRTLKIDP
jgi:hypothetical protein